MTTRLATTSLARRVAAAFAIWLVLVQAVIGVPLGQTVMSPLTALPGGGFAICTAGGPVDAGPGHHPPADQAPACPFCMPLCGGVATLAVAAPLPVPRRSEPLVRQPASRPAAFPAAPRQSAQPRGPPALI